MNYIAVYVPCETMDEYESKVITYCELICNYNIKIKFNLTHVITDNVYCQFIPGYLYDKGNYPIPMLFDEVFGFPYGGVMDAHLLLKNPKSTERYKGVFVHYIADKELGYL